MCHRDVKESSEEKVSVRFLSVCACTCFFHHCVRARALSISVCVYVRFLSACTCVFHHCVCVRALSISVCVYVRFLSAFIWFSYKQNVLGAPQRLRPALPPTHIQHEHRTEIITHLCFRFCGVLHLLVTSETLIYAPRIMKKYFY